MENKELEQIIELNIDLDELEADCRDATINYISDFCVSDALEKINPLNFGIVGEVDQRKFQDRLSELIIEKIQTRIFGENNNGK